MIRKICLLIFIFPLIILASCSTNQPAEETTIGTLIKVVFDGENCLVTGHESEITSSVNFEFDNQSDASVFLAMPMIKRNESPDEIFSTFMDGSTDYPEGVVNYGRSRSISAGMSFDDFGFAFYDGQFAVMCEITSTNEKFFGAVFSIP